MAVPLRHVLRQGANLSALAGAAVTAYRSKGRSGGTFVTPGPVVQRELQPPPADLVSDYVRLVGGDPRSYKGQVPAHLFPQWAFSLMSETMEGLPYDISKVINAGCTMQLNAPLPAKGSWLVTACLQDIDDDERRVLLSQRITTGPHDDPEALVATVTILIPKRVKGPKPKSAPKTVPTDARELAMWKLDGRAGLDFAILTGDFNPIHWIPLAARAAGFKGCINHGFSTMARALEGLIATRYAGRVDAFATTEVRFAAPLTLPGKVGLYADTRHGFFVGAAPGAPACLIGSYVPREPTP